MLTIATHTLGCKVNQYDTQKILGKFFELGFREVDFTEIADVYLINSCSVTHVAEHKSRQFVAKVLKRNPHAQIIMAGCYSRLEAEQVLKIPGISGIIQNCETLAPLDVEELWRSLTPPGQADSDETDDSLSSPRMVKLRRNLVIQTGCEEFCAYCIIPYARGKLWSKPAELILEEANKLLKEDGAKELILTGINLGAYSIVGQSASSPVIQLSDIVESLTKIEGLLRLRISSIEPQYWTQELLDCIEDNPKVCQHFHIPLQSGCDRILKRMNRKYTTWEYDLLIRKILSMFPDAAITTDVITGFPGETEEDYLETNKFIEQQGFAQVHSFKFSPRKGTPAAEMTNQVPQLIIQERMDKLQELGKKLQDNYRQKFVGKQMEVLWESYDSNKHTLSGLTENYLRIIQNGKTLKIGRLENVDLNF